MRQHKRVAVPVAAALVLSWLSLIASSLPAGAAGPIIVGNNAAFGGGPIQSYDFSTGGAPVASFVPTGASDSNNGRGIVVIGSEVYYTELSGGFGASDAIHVAPYNGGTGGADTRSIPNPRPGTGIQDLKTFGGVLYALTGYPSSPLEVFKLNPISGTVLGPPIVIGPGASPTSDGFTVLPNSNFLINSSDESCTYNQFNGTTGVIVPATTILVPGGAFDCTGVDTDGTSLFFQTNFNSFTQTTLSGTLVAQKSVSSNLVEDISILHPPVGDQAISAQGTTFSATEGKSFTGSVATFTDPDPNDNNPADYSATIDWGDGNSSNGVVTLSGACSASGCNYSVSGSHTYAEEGTYNVTVKITDVDTPSNTATANSTAKVADAPLTASPACSATSAQAYNGLTAKFTDAASPFGTLSDFSATINWGDSSSSAGTVSGPNGGPYAVSGSHTYASTGTFTITTTINDVGGSTASTSCKTLVFAFAPGGGSFVIGDQNAVVGNAVTFWGAQWWKANQLSGGSAPASFKGFAENPTTPSCGTGWSTDPGNSAPPPAGPLPAYMGVIVTGQVTKSGSEIDGNTVHIVVVQTNPGYQPDPGHPGTGKVVAIVC
jgi:hypothetical protein